MTHSVVNDCRVHIRIGQRVVRNAEHWEGGAEDGGLGHVGSVRIDREEQVSFGSSEAYMMSHACLNCRVK